MMANWLQRRFGIGKKSVDIEDALSVVMAEVFGTGNKKVNSIRGALQQSPWVSRAVRVLSQSSADVPWQVVDGANKPLPLAITQTEQAGGSLTWTELVERTIAQQSLYGYAVWYAELKRVTLVNADTVKVELAPSGDFRYTFRTPRPGIDQSKLITFPNWTYQSSPTGEGELQSCMDAANLEESAIELMENILGNGGLLAGLLSTDQDLSETEVSAVKQAFEEKYGGRNAGSIAVMGRGLTFQKIGVSPGDFSALDVSKITRQMIAAAFGVPAIYLMDTESVDYANSQTQERMFYQTNIQPRVNRLADRITRFAFPLLGIKGKYKCDWSKVKALQDDAKLMAETDEINLRSGVTYINEIRARDGKDPVDGGDQPLVSAMLVPLGATTVHTRDEVVAVAQAVEDTSSAGAAADATTPSKGVSSPVDEGKAIQKGIAPETRRIIAKAFLSTVRPQEKKFASETMKTFNAQAKDVIAWVEEHEKAVPATTLRATLKDEDLVERWHSLFVAFGKQALESVADRYDMQVPDGSVILKWIRAQESKHSKLVNDTTADEISKILADARANGESIPDMVAKTKQYFDNIGYRAERVARCNVVACNNAAAQDVYVENGVEKHEWLATNDDRTRDDHAEADGQVKPINEPFDVGGEQLMYPGDPAGSAENTIQCRCTELPVV
jgi:HK97 family phage portal protein